MRIIEHHVAFLNLAKRASNLPHTKSWESATVSEKRCQSLASAPIGSGHDKYLSGICVFAVIDAGHIFWLQFAEYHFKWDVSSTSKMHTYPSWDEEKMGELPLSYELTKAVVLNYRQLKTMFRQRKSHRMDSWRVFCDWIRDLPEAHLITQEPQTSVTTYPPSTTSEIVAEVPAALTY
jgi:hypothetical protein